MMFAWFRSFADTLGCATLVIACQKFIKKFFARVSETEEFLNLPIRDVASLISEDELYVTTEEQVFTAVIR